MWNKKTKQQPLICCHWVWCSLSPCISLAQRPLDTHSQTGNERGPAEVDSMMKGFGLYLAKGGSGEITSIRCYKDKTDPFNELDSCRRWDGVLLPSQFTLASSWTSWFVMRWGRKVVQGTHQNSEVVWMCSEQKNMGKTKDHDCIYPDNQS